MAVPCRCSIRNVPARGLNTRRGSRRCCIPTALLRGNCSVSCCGSFPQRVASSPRRSPSARTGGVSGAGASCRSIVPRHCTASINWCGAQQAPWFWRRGKRPPRLRRVSFHHSYRRHGREVPKPIATWICRHCAGGVSSAFPTRISQAAKPSSAGRIVGEGRAAASSSSSPMQGRQRALPIPSRHDRTAGTSLTRKPRAGKRLRPWIGSRVGWRGASCSLTPPLQPRPRAMAQSAPATLNDAQADAEIARLAGLLPLAYGRERTTAAKAMGLQATFLDKGVKAKQAKTRDALAGEAAVEAGGRGRPINLPDPEPWPHPVDGDELLRALTAAIKKYMVLEDGAA